jgi:hypothetical protein
MTGEIGQLTILQTIFRISRSPTPLSIRIQDVPIYPFSVLPKSVAVNIQQVSDAVYITARILPAAPS